MNIHEVLNLVTPMPWGSSSGVVTCADDGEHIGSFRTNTLTESLPGLHRMNGTASAAYAAHCCNNFMKALAELRRLADNQDMFTEEELVDHARVDLSLLAELEEVK